jgi:hypothetical protein
VIAGAALLLLVIFVAAGFLPVFALLGLAGVPLFVKAAVVARKSYNEPMELVPANAYTAVGHLASALGLAIGLTWAGAGGGINAGVLLVAIAGIALILYYNRSIGRLSKAFYGVKEAVAKV